MNTFKQFLIEDINPTTGEEIALQIVDLCRPYLRQGGGILFDLYRGLTVEKDFLIKEVRADRKPLNTPVVMQRFLDRWFTQKFHHPYRSNAIYATGDTDYAAGYGSGEVYRVYPIGSFSYIWSPEVDDLFIDMGKIHQQLQQAGEYEERTRLTELTDEQKQIVDQFLTDAGYIDHNLQQAAESGHEVMIATEKYIAVHNDTAQEKNVAEHIKRIAT